MDWTNSHLMGKSLRSSKNTSVKKPGSVFGLLTKFRFRARRSRQDSKKDAVMASDSILDQSFKIQCGRRKEAVVFRRL